MGQNTKSNVVTGFLWRFAERCGAQGVSFIVSIVLARILAPEAYGTIALITVFTSILGVFVDSGFGTALVQKKDADDLDFSSVFYFNVFVCCVIYVIMFFAAPLIANFYNNPELVPLVRVLCITTLISGVKNVQQAYVSRNLLFKRFFYATLGGTIGAAVIGITIAYLGGGVWALVVQQIFNTTVDAIILWITVKWRPKLMFSFKRLKGLYSFGWKLLASTLLDRVYSNIRQLIIGKLYSPSDLAFYNRGRTFPDMIVTNVNTSIDSVLLPAMSSAQDNVAKVKDMTRRAIKTSTYIMAPLMMGLAFMATPVIRIILTEKWIASVPFLRVFCITYMFMPIHTANLNAIKAMGRSDLFLRLEIIKKIMGVSVLLLVMWHGIMAMAYSLLFTCIMAQIINSWPNKKLLGYSYIDQLKDILPSILLAVFMGFCVSFIALVGLPDIITIILQVIAGAVIYITGSYIFKLEAFEYLLDMIKGFLSKRKSIKV